MSSDVAGKEPKFDTDKDRYPKIRKVVSRVVDSPDMPAGDIERIEITCLASGEATWRVWEARAEDPVGGYLPPE